MSNYRVWCLTWEDDEERNSRDYPDQPPSGLSYVDQVTNSDTWATDAVDAVELYAEWCHNQRDGWDTTWPLKFRVRSPDGSLTDFVVEREYEPTFTAIRSAKVETKASA
jgi:hypothetical protein